MPVRHKNEVIWFGAPYYRIFRSAEERVNDPLAEKKLQLEIDSLTQQMSQLASTKRKLRKLYLEVEDAFRSRSSPGRVAVERLKNCDNIVALAPELGVIGVCSTSGETNWTRLRSQSNHRQNSPESTLRMEVSQLKRLVAASTGSPKAGALCSFLT